MHLLAKPRRKVFLKRPEPLLYFDVRLRHKKTNFSALVDPFDVGLTFEKESITAEVKELQAVDRAQEGTLTARTRVLAALEGGPAFPLEIAEKTGLAKGSVQNQITLLKKAGRVVVTGVLDGRSEQVKLVSSSSRPLKGSDGDDANSKTVAGLLATPPRWLVSQMDQARVDPARHLGPLCTAVAKEVLGSGLRKAEVKDDVLAALDQDVLEF